MTRPRLLDLFCGGGGAGAGYHRAGFEVTGVDLAPKPRYPHEFVQGDAFEVLSLTESGEWQFDAIHASPPCQDHSATRVLGSGHGTGWMLAAVRERLAAMGVPWVIENVGGSSLPRQPDLFGANGVELCGCMFPSLRGFLYEPRLFETSFQIAVVPHRRHIWPQTKMGRPPQPGECMQVTGHFSDAAEARRRMGAPWMTRDELAQAIPPAYAEYIGGRLMEAVRAGEAA